MKITGDQVTADEWNALGAHPGHVSNRYYGNISGTSKNVSSMGNFNHWAVPVYVPIRRSYTHLAFEITTGVVGSRRYGIYLNAGGIPGALREEVGLIPNDTTGVKEQALVDQVFDRGWYWLSCSGGAVNPSYRSWPAGQNPNMPITQDGGPAVGWSMSGDGSALPANYSTTPGLLTGPIAILTLKAA